MINSNNEYLLCDIAQNRKLSPEDLRELFITTQDNKKGFSIEWALATNPNTHEDILRTIAKKINYNDQFDYIKYYLKNNPSTPKDIKDKL